MLKGNSKIQNLLPYHIHSSQMESREFVCKVVPCVIGIARKRRKWSDERMMDALKRANAHRRFCISSSCGVVDLLIGHRRGTYSTAQHYTQLLGKVIQDEYLLYDSRDNSNILSAEKPAKR
ncbi:hypothetical protein G9A89_023424 [Geosiphon pyriformis]|nr:hypothetical protein G9A89_023424 [Geosiphon pyriformis]